MPKTYPGRNAVGALYSNYKTLICKNFTKHGICKFGENCCFAHGTDELRTLTDPMPKVPNTVLLYSPPNMRLGADS